MFFFFKHDKQPVAIPKEKPGKACSGWTSMASAKGRHTDILYFMTLSAFLRTVVMCFSLLLNLKKNYLVPGKSIVMAVIMTFYL